MKTTPIRRRSLLLLAGLALALAAGARPASAARVTAVAATQDLAWVTSAVGGPNVSVDYLASSNEDPHGVEPRPSQAARLARANLVVRVGLDLDLWFDALIRRAGNPRVLPGAAGYVDASRGVRLLEIPSGKLDPSRGDIHIYGNPHYFFGPSNLPAVVRNVRDGLKRVDPSGAPTYDANAAVLVQRLNESLPRWKQQLAPHRGKGVVTYHKSLIYLLAEFGLREVGNVEPRPGLEPTAGHVGAVARQMKAEGVRVILTEGWRPRRFANVLAGQSGGRVVPLPGGVGAEKGLDDYFRFMDACVERLASAL